MQKPRMIEMVENCIDLDLFHKSDILSDTHWMVVEETSVVGDRAPLQK